MTSEFDRFKTEGNRLLKAGEIEMAVVLYTSAAAAAESSRQAAIALGNRSLRERVRRALLVCDRVRNEQRECEMPFFTRESSRRSGRCAARGTGVS